MTTIALRLAPADAAPLQPDWLRRLFRRIVAVRRHRHYPGVRLERARAVDRWVSDTLRHR